MGALLALAVGCHELPARQVTWSDGRAAYVIYDITGLAYDRVGKTCPDGYDVLDLNRERDASSWVTIVFRCK
jgi:hypothetical protein